MAAISATPDLKVCDDVVIVGGGIGGLFCALKMAPRPVTLVSAAPIGEVAPSTGAQDGIAAVSDADTPEKHAAETVAAGGGIADERIALLMAREGPERVRELIAWGAPLDRDADGGEIMAALVAAVRRTPSIRLIESYSAEELVKDGSRVAGLIAIAENGDAGPPEIRLSARAVVLASGGVGALFAVTTNGPQARGQGVAIAARAGALVADTEFVQFHRAVTDVAPAAHFHMGGVLTDANGRTSVDGLWACGEVASTGVHGANLLASNALIEAVVFAARVADDIRLIYPAPQPMPAPEVVSDAEGPSLFVESGAIARLRRTMSEHVGVVRDRDGLVAALADIAEIERQGGASHGFRNMITTARLIASAALMRTESRGAHLRSDHPEPDPAQARRTILTLRGAEAAARAVLAESEKTYA